ncbi:bifunctional molybdenum cofactor biosynthesis protein MoaC/MoaB [Sphingobacterium faecium]|uniref:bifunctional molybdenum cofactor biosynthesis protein MoaC/MoaB n=1 Tax=Sphingobacterium faecium TaxID=34087 RepID=UPI0024697A38|nr:bifunctional molybdenum cofactor biosynthesis protein MoaC/MoaB [Sphingobacterium faecium]MDH5827019.1 bifunctional molybdenum cofactor biosynthesis protein MoaC/MoaB [Sphingobacterium faecium]
MEDITGKQIRLEEAAAVAVIFCTTKTLELIRENKLSKGSLFDIARTAGFVGAKLTPQLLPHRHPTTIDAMDISMNINDAERPRITINGSAKSIGRTGIEMEILTAVTVAALHIFDMLKTVDTTLEIGEIKLLKATGGKNQDKKYFSTPPTCAILVCSDSTAAGKREDKSGIIIRQLLQQVNAHVVAYEIIADDKTLIQKQVLKWVAEDVHFIFTTGGTGLGPRDNTVSAVSEILERDADGITEAMRNFGQMRTSMAMMSRAVAGSIAHTLILTLPGSTDGARESLEAVLPAIFHARKMMKGGGH